MNSAGAGRVHRESRPFPAGHRRGHPRHVQRQDVDVSGPRRPAQANFHGTVTEIDLFAGEAGLELWPPLAIGSATNSARKSASSSTTELERRIFTPFTGMVTAGKPRMWWLAGTNNWNAVCMAGVTGAAMANIQSRERRAFFAASAEKYIQNFLKGFTHRRLLLRGRRLLELRLRPLRDAGRNLEAGHRRQSGHDGFRPRPPDRPVRAADSKFCRVSARPSPTSEVSSQPDVQITAFLSRRYGWGMKDVEARGLGLAQGRSRGPVRAGSVWLSQFRDGNAGGERGGRPAGPPRRLYRRRHPRLPTRTR